MKKNNLILMIVVLTAILFSASGYAQTVTIGSQVWSKKNLDVSTFRNGNPIMQAKSLREWFYACDNGYPAWCYYNCDPSNGTKYGKLYNRFAVADTSGLAPVGYHIPTDVEWTILGDYLGGNSVAGKKMKSSSGWNGCTLESQTKICPNCASWSAEYCKKVPCHKCKDTRYVSSPTALNSGNGSNSSGFSGLPGGTYHNFYGFTGIGLTAAFWEVEVRYGLHKARQLNCLFGDELSQGLLCRESGFSVRCIKD